MTAAGKLARCLRCGEDYTIPATGPIVCPDCGPERPATRPALGALAAGVVVVLLLALFGALWLVDAADPTEEES